MVNLERTKVYKERLKENPEDYRSIIEDADMAITLTDRHGTIVEVNDNWLKLNRQTRENAIGQNFTFTLEEDAKKPMQKAHDQFFVDHYDNFRDWHYDSKEDGLRHHFFIDALYFDLLDEGPMKITFLVSTKAEKITKA